LLQYVAPSPENLYSFTFTAWFHSVQQTNLNGINTIITVQRKGGNWHDNHVGFYIGWGGRANLRLYFNRGSYMTQTDVVPLDRWTHLAVSYEYGSKYKKPLFHFISLFYFKYKIEGNYM